MSTKSTRNFKNTVYALSLIFPDGIDVDLTDHLVDSGGQCMTRQALVSSKSYKVFSKNLKVVLNPLKPSIGPTTPNHTPSNYENLNLNKI